MPSRYVGNNDALDASGDVMISYIPNSVKTSPPCNFPHRKCLTVSLIQNKQYGMHVNPIQIKQLRMRLHRSEMDVQEIRKFGFVTVSALLLRLPSLPGPNPRTNPRLPRPKNSKSMCSQ